MSERPGAWNADPRHDWPGGHYIGATCRVCGVFGFVHHKNGPRLCWPHWKEENRKAEWQQAKWRNEMTAEYGPYTPRTEFPSGRAALRSDGGKDA